jgi:hypothetical protein
MIKSMASDIKKIESHWSDVVEELREVHGVGAMSCSFPMPVLVWVRSAKLRWAVRETRLHCFRLGRRV